jgi:hypothetical protein
MGNESLVRQKMSWSGRKGVGQAEKLGEITRVLIRWEIRWSGRK